MAVERVVGQADAAGYRAGDASAAPLRVATRGLGLWQVLVALCRLDAC
jgi:hypothetical protein